MSGPALVGHTHHYQSSDSTTNSLASAYTPVSGGNSIIAMGVMAGTPSTAAFSDGVNMYNTAFALASGYANAWIAAAVADNISSSALTLELATTGSVLSQLILAEVSGLNSSGSFDAVSAIAGASSATPTSNNATPSIAGDYAIFFTGIVAAPGSIGSFTNGFSEEDHALNGPSYGWADQVLSGTSPISGGCTLSGANSWSAIVLLFKAASAPALDEDAEWIQFVQSQTM
jgi:hypothetical protein